MEDGAPEDRGDFESPAAVDWEPEPDFDWDLSLERRMDMEWWEQQAEDAEDAWNVLEVPFEQVVEAVLEDESDLLRQNAEHEANEGEEIYEAENAELEYDRERWNEYEEAVWNEYDEEDA